jgi:hypothetical protein
MPNPKPIRGRPKGTGRDDSAILQSLLHLVEGNPALKPTTAIKSMGVTDPSAIRRLRDKFSLIQATHAAPVASSAAARRDQAARVARAVTLKTPTEPVRTAPVVSRAAAPVIAAGANQSKPQNPPAPKPAITAKQLASPSATHAESVNWFSLWTEIGLHSMATSLRAQWIIYDHVLRSPPVTAALNGHSVLTDFAAAWCAMSPDPGKTIH